MEIIRQHPKPKPILGVCFPHIFLPDSKIQHLKPQEQTSLALLKYFPKHIHSLPSDLSHLKTRIKRLKLVEKIPSDHPNNVLRVLLSNKRKSVKSASGLEDRASKGGYHKQTYELLKMFPNVQKVELCIEYQFFVDAYHQRLSEKQDYWVDRMSNYLPRMTNLKHLKLSNRGYHLLPLLSKLNSFERMLNRLEVFKLNFLLIGPDDFPDFQALFNFTTILKHLTYLKLELPEDDDFFEGFQLLPDYCPRLISLVTSVIQYTYNSKIEQVRYLQCLQGFQNLQQLSLNCGKNFDSFRHCQFPTSLRFLNLYLDSAKWESFLIENSPITAFHREQEGLENLEKLNLFIYLFDPTEEKDIVRDFIKALLRRVPALKEFTMEFYPQLQIWEGVPSYPFDLSQFLSGFQHLSHSLERLTIIDDHSRYNFTNFENTQAFQFPKLSYLYIKARSFPSLPVLENIIKLAQAKPERPTPYVKLESVKIDSCKALLELFSSLKKISGRHIELVILYYSTIEDDEYFKENHDEVKKDSRNLRNVNLEIRFSRAWPRFRWKKEFKSLEELFGNFVVIENVDF